MTISTPHRHAYGSRQRSEPPTLWISLVTGSILIHAFALLGMRVWLGRETKVPSRSSAPISVEFVQPFNQRSAPKAPPLSLPRFPLPRSPSLASATPRRTELPQNPPSTQSDQEIKPSRPIPPRQAFPQTKLPKPPVLPPLSKSRPADLPNQNPERSPALNLSDPNRPGDGLLPTVNVSQNPGQGRDLQITITQVESANGAKDVNDGDRGVARPLTMAKALPAVAYPTAVELNLGAPVRLLLLVDRDGKPRLVEVKRGSPAQEYTQLIKQFIQEIQFEPALQAGQPVDSLVEVELTIQAR